MVYTSEYPVFWVTADMVLVTGPPGDRSVLLIQRGHEPDAGAWAFPGGFVDPDEDLADAAVRELAEETGLDTLDGIEVVQLGAYGAPRRDPRGRVVSVAYLAEVPRELSARAGDDAAAARWWPVAELVAPDSPVRFAFDHALILADALRRLGESASG